MRKLASIKRIDKINSIPNADKIEVATIEGWQVVVGKGMYNPGDLIIFCEIDSILPYDKFPEAEKFGGRIRTIKLRGQISQGYCAPLSLLEGIELKEDQDVTELLGITKYELPQKFTLGTAVGEFPSHIIPKTDEERIQSNKKYLEIFQNRIFVSTVKYDGSSWTSGWDRGEFFVASHNYKRKFTEECKFWEPAKKYGFENFPKNLVFQGELCGPGIQKNKLNLTNYDVFIFMIFDQNEKRYLTYDERIEICKDFKIKHVEMNNRGIFKYNSIEELLFEAEGKYFGTKNSREGIVFEIDENITFQKFSKFNRTSFKVISNNYLLKDGN